MSNITSKLFALCLLLVLIPGTILNAQKGLRQQDLESPVEKPFSINELPGFDNLKIFSNTGILNVKFENQFYGKVNIRVYDIAGREVVNEKEQKSDSQFTFKHDSSKLPHSVYIIRITQNKSQINRKVYL